MGFFFSKPIPRPPPPPPPDITLIPPRIYLKKEKKVTAGDNLLAHDHDNFMDFVPPSDRFFSFAFSSAEISNDDATFRHKAKIGTQLWASKVAKKIGGNLRVAVDSEPLFTLLSLETESPKHGTNASASMQFIPSVIHKSLEPFELFGSLEAHHLEDRERKTIFRTLGLAYNLFPEAAEGGKDGDRPNGEDEIDRMRNPLARVALSLRSAQDKDSDLKLYGFSRLGGIKVEGSLVVDPDFERLQIKDSSFAVGLELGSKRNRRSLSPTEVLFSASRILSDDAQLSLTYYSRLVVSRNVMIALENKIKRIHNYVDFAIRTSYLPKATNPSVGIEVSGSWQINKNNMLKGTFCSSEISANYVFKNWWMPRSTFVASAIYNLPNNSSNIGFSLLLDNEDADYKMEEVKDEDFRTKAETLRVGIPSTPSGAAGKTLFDPKKLD